jgi:hypothetical protein
MSATLGRRLAYPGAGVHLSTRSKAAVYCAIDCVNFVSFNAIVVVEGL